MQLENQFVFDKGNYPKDLTTSLALLKKFKSSGRGRGTDNNQATAGINMVSTSNKTLEQREC